MSEPSPQPEGTEAALPARVGAGRSRPAVVTVAVLAAFLLGRWPSLTWGSSLVVVCAGAAVCVAGYRSPGPEPDARAPWRRGLPWLAVGLALALWELALLLLGNNDAWPPLSRLADPVERLGAGRFLLAVAWLGAGDWLVRRCRR